MDLAKLSNVANALASKALEVRRDATAFQVDDASGRLVHERAHRRDGVATHAFSSKRVDHCFETHIGLADTDDLGLVIRTFVRSVSCPTSTPVLINGTYNIARVVGLEDSYFDALISKVSLTEASMSRSWVVRVSIALSPRIFSRHTTHL